MAVGAFALAGGTGAGFNHLAATMSGYQETPSISSTGTAEFTADISKDGQSIARQLTYADLEGTVTQSHIHFGQRAVAGGISVFLCTNLGNGPAGTQPCPQPTSGACNDQRNDHPGGCLAEHPGDGGGPGSRPEHGRMG